MLIQCSCYFPIRSQLATKSIYLFRGDFLFPILVRSVLSAMRKMHIQQHEHRTHYQITETAFWVMCKANRDIESLHFL